MTTIHGMKISLLFLCASAGQSFLNKPRSRSFWKSLSTISIASPEHVSGSTIFAEALAGTSEGLVGTQPASSETEVLVASEDFMKPDRDLRQYRYIRLKNNLKVLLVRNPIQPKTNVDNAATVEAAAMHIQAGHFDDSSISDSTGLCTDASADASSGLPGLVHSFEDDDHGGLPGLGHFFEHMVFLGTEKYPGEDDYEGFLSKHGGFSNAYTDMEDTNYYFSITTQANESDSVSEGLSGALDRFSQFFIAPRFEESMAERELRAIDSEYRNGKTSDAWRNYQFLKSIANQKHPFSNFGCGNYETLMSAGKPPIDQLRTFLKKYYTTSNMRLAVVSSGSLDSLQKVVEETFGQLPYSNHPPRREKFNPNSLLFPRENAVYNPNEPAFGEEQLGKIREVIPLLESRTLKVQFATPPMADPVLRATRPHRVISHLLGHESKGSLHCILNDLNLITGLTSGTAIDASDFSLFGLTLTLTPKGMDQKDLILDLVFQWIYLIRETAVKSPELMAEYHNELRQISATNFKFRENGDPTEFCSTAAELLFDDEHPNEILASGSLVKDYDPLIANAFLERLSPENAMVTIINSAIDEEDNDGWNIEPLYGAKYREYGMTPENLRQWKGNEGNRNSKLHIPDLNGYIPTDFSLRCDDNGQDKVMDNSKQDECRRTAPVLIEQGPNFKFYHKLDRFWRVPKSFIRLSIVSPEAYSSPRSMTLSRIYERVLNDDLNSFLYDASLAGCSYRLSCTPSGYKLSMKGYSEKLVSLFETLTSRMLSLLDELEGGKEKNPALFSKFEKAKESLLRETKNYRLDTPHEVANYNSRLLLEENVWFLDDYIDEMECADAHHKPLKMEECGETARKCLNGRLKVNSLCIGNIDEESAKTVGGIISQRFLSPSIVLRDSETPNFKSVRLPTRDEAILIFGQNVACESIPVKVQELARSPSEENCAVELTFQTGCDLTLGYEGIGIVDLISHLAYLSAYNKLRTQEQLGYIVSAFTRKTAGSSWGLSVVVQSSNSSPLVLEDRIENWLQLFRQELEDMTAEAIAMEARGMVGQLLEENTRLSQEVGSVWGEVIATECHEQISPVFDRLQRLADELVLTSEESSETTKNGNPRKSPEQLKKAVLDFFDKYYAPDAPERRVMSSRVYSLSLKDEYETTAAQAGVLSSYSSIRYFKTHLSTWPITTYWRAKFEDKQA